MQESQPQWTNYIVGSKFVKASEGHLPSDTLLQEMEKCLGKEAYFTVYDLEKRDTFKGYEGKTRPALDMVYFDLDGEAALEETRAFVQWLGVSERAIWFSGNKGFHVGVQKEYFGPWHDDMPERLRFLAAKLKEKWPCIDTTVYNPNRKFRVPGSKHEKTGLHKIRVNIAENLESMKQKAIAPGILELTTSFFCGPKEPLPQVMEILSQYQARPKRAKSEDTGDFVPDSGAVEAGCGFLKHCKDNAKSIDEPQWYAMLSVVGRLDDGYKKAHKYSEPHPDYDSDSTDRKLDQALESSLPRTCESIGTLWSGCKDCKYNGRINSPISIKAEPRVEEDAISSRELVPLQWRINPKTGVRVPPAEITVANALLTNYGDDIIKAHTQDLFLWTGTHWKHLDKLAEDRLKQQLNFLAGNFGKYKDNVSCFNRFKLHVPRVPQGVNLFEPNPFVANFKNGSLHLVRSQDHKYTLEFREHRRGDYLINLLPYDYEPGRESVNSEFLAMLDRVFEGDPDRGDKILAVQEMYGACLVPAFPRLFMCWGDPNTGKSTVLKIAAKLIGKENMSFIPPSDFHGFLMQPMAGKLVNMDTDVPTDKPISDAIVKKIIERAPMNIQRKGIENVWAHIPAVHLFGGNEIPETRDTSGAHKRRWTFIKFERVVDAGGAKFKGEYWDYCFEQGPVGILNWALAGLERLCANGGRFTVPESGVDKMKEWSASNDMVKHFIEAIENKEVYGYENKIPAPDPWEIYLDKNAKIKRGDLARCWGSWSGAGMDRVAPKQRVILYSQLRLMGFSEKPVEGVRYFEGIGLRVGGKSCF